MRPKIEHPGLVTAAESNREVRLARIDVFAVEPIGEEETMAIHQRSTPQPWQHSNNNETPDCNQRFARHAGLPPARLTPGFECATGGIP